ncbi:hypothetical protein BKA64DRAFT_481518 [Cadophora sp. MPI-SDFR-AT-0126]|nr:hypothetical protein BKA64DRAFT_481518 [Leotiomycetes sp. MPI-SDFR-AT-0126]
MSMTTFVVKACLGCLTAAGACSNKVTHLKTNFSTHWLYRRSLCPFLDVVSQTKIHFNQLWQLIMPKEWVLLRSSATRPIQTFDCQLKSGERKITRLTVAVV